MRCPVTTPIVAGMILAGLAVVVGHAAQVATRPGASRPPDPVVDRILTRLERRQVHDLRARLVWELMHVIEEEEQPERKFGTIWYKQTEPVAKFKVHFDTKLSGGRRRKLDEEHLFDGRWYVELQSATRTVIYREIRREGDTRNPYRLGEGAFPLPFGQKKADILAEFAVERLPPRPDDPPKTDHLRLTPRPGTRTGESYKTLEFWVAQEGPHAGLPVKVVAGKKDGTGAVNSYITISFSRIELNTGLSDSVFKIEPPPGYEKIVERLEPIESNPAGGPGTP